MDNTIYCKKCSPTRSCGKNHLYVIELDYDLTKNKRFMKDNKNYIPGMDCLYVGATSHTPLCRFTQHKLHAKKRTLGYTCSCFGKERFHEFVRGGGHTRGSYYPGVYGLRLRPDLFTIYNPLSGNKKAFFKELTLAKLLKAKGYAVWQH